MYKWSTDKHLFRKKEDKTNVNLCKSKQYMEDLKYLCED